MGIRVAWGHVVQLIALPLGHDKVIVHLTDKRGQFRHSTAHNVRPFLLFPVSVHNGRPRRLLRRQGKTSVLARRRVALLTWSAKRQSSKSQPNGAVSRQTQRPRLSHRNGPKELPASTVSFCSRYSRTDKCANETLSDPSTRIKLLHSSRIYGLSIERSIAPPGCHATASTN
jgi:hypothetical protein